MAPQLNMVSSSSLRATRLATFGIGLAARTACRLPIAPFLLRELPALGPTGVKAGQFMSGRPDVFGDDIATALDALRDRAPPMRFEIVQKILGDHARNFSFVDPNPIAAASIGQVHRGTLAKDGRVVAIKIRRPTARDEILADSAIITAAADKWASPRVKRATREFCESLAEESDFVAEARRAKEFAESVLHDDFLVVPRVIAELCRDDVLVSEFVRSVGILEYAATLSPRKRRALAKQLMTAFMTQLLEGDFVHGDPHLGNMGMIPGGQQQQRLVLYDFGCVVAMDDTFRTLLKDLVLCMLLEDAEGALATLRAMKDDMEIVDMAEAEKYVALYFSYAKSLDIAPFAAASKDTRTAPIRFSSRITRLVRAFATLEGTCTSIDPSFNYYDLAVDFLPMFVDRQFVAYRVLADARKLFFL